MPFQDPELVDSPRAKFQLERVVLNRGEHSNSYCLGRWEGRPVIGFRWNGGGEQPKGNPLSRGFPTWTIMDAQDYPVLVTLFPLEEQAYAREFLRISPRS